MHGVQSPVYTAATRAVSNMGLVYIESCDSP